MLIMNFSSPFLFTSVLCSFTSFPLLSFNLGALKKDFLHVLLCFFSFPSLSRKTNKHFATNQNQIREIVKTIQFQQIIQFHVQLKISVAFQLENVLRSASGIRIRLSLLFDNSIFALINVAGSDGELVFVP
jgi:hypothetical protein